MEFQPTNSTQARIKFHDRVFLITEVLPGPPRYAVTQESGPPHEFLCHHLNNIANGWDFERGTEYIPHEAYYMAKRIQRNFWKHGQTKVEILWFSHRGQPEQPSNERETIY